MVKVRETVRVSTRFMKGHERVNDQSQQAFDWQTLIRCRYSTLTCSSRGNHKKTTSCTSLFLAIPKQSTQAIKHTGKSRMVKPKARSLEGSPAYVSRTNRQIGTRIRIPRNSPPRPKDKDTHTRHTFSSHLPDPFLSPVPQGPPTPQKPRRTEHTLPTAKSSCGISVARSKPSAWRGERRQGPQGVATWWLRAVRRRGSGHHLTCLEKRKVRVNGTWRFFVAKVKCQLVPETLTGSIALHLFSNEPKPLVFGRIVRVP